MRQGLPSPPKPLRPISSERRHFCRLSLNVRPMAIASPTLFICVVSVNGGRHQHPPAIQYFFSPQWSASRLASAAVREMTAPCLGEEKFVVFITPSLK